MLLVWQARTLCCQLFREYGEQGQLHALAEDGEQASIDARSQIIVLLSHYRFWCLVQRTVHSRRVLLSKGPNQYKIALPLMSRRNFRVLS
jgi:hypothetical protein